MNLGFLDFRDRDARLDACQREVTLNRRLAGQVYLGLVDVLDASGAVVDVAVVMRRVQDDRQFATRAQAGGELTGCIHDVARALASFHADQPPTDDPAGVRGRAAHQARSAEPVRLLRR